MCAVFCGAFFYMDETFFTWMKLTAFIFDGFKEELI